MDSIQRKERVIDEEVKSYEAVDWTDYALGFMVLAIVFAGAWILAAL